MPQIKFELPVSFRATPLRQRIDKYVCGHFLEPCDIPEVEGFEVLPVLDLKIGEETREYFDIKGRFFRRMPQFDPGDPSSAFELARSPIPWVKGEIADMERNARREAKKSELAIFPKIGSDDLVSGSLLERNWFDDGSLTWLDRRRDRATAYLETLRWSEGSLYEPVPEPVFVVSVGIGREDVINGVSVDFRSSDQSRFVSGCPVAFFRADQQVEAIDHALELAKAHDTGPTTVDLRDIHIHDSRLLRFDTDGQHLDEAINTAFEASRHMRISSQGIDPAWRETFDDLMMETGVFLSETWNAAAGAHRSEEMCAEAERHVRRFIDIWEDYPEFPAIMFKLLLERWEARPVLIPEMGGPDMLAGL